MGQKVHPIGMRVGIIRDWDAKWYAEKEYADYLMKILQSVNSFKKNLLTQQFQLLKSNAQ
ncbi:30S ribosomal protein S3 [Streptococcus pneumoniae]|nr:30S ribosomal protein S3 [Streptococcus pneumoniae]